MQLQIRKYPTDPQTAVMRSCLLQKMTEKLIQHEDPLSNITASNERDQLKLKP